MADILEDLTYGYQERIMIDVGGHHGSAFSPFLDRNGWEIHTFEPDTINRETLEQRFRDDPRVHINAYAVSDTDASRQPIYRSDISSGISTLSPFHPSHRPVGTVETITLRTYCRVREITDVHYLKTDTEGFDLFVLTGFDWDRYSPLAVMCEFEDSKTTPLGYNYRDLVELLTQQGYTVWVSEWSPVTEYGVQHSWLELRQTPHELTRERSWGNLIALRDPITDNEMQAFVERRITFTPRAK